MIQSLSNYTKGINSKTKMLEVHKGTATQEHECLPWENPHGKNPATFSIEKLFN